MAKLKILHINTYQGGGSGIAAMRLHKALCIHGYDSNFLFLDKGTITETTFQYRKRPYLWILLLRILKKLGLPFTTEQKNDYSIRKYKYDVEMFSFANTSYKNLHEHPLVKDSDIIHLHWISDFVDFKSFFCNIKKQVFWTLHDMNAFLGGFHYKGDETSYGEKMKDLDTRQKIIKYEALKCLPSSKLFVITPSAWLGHLSKESEVLKKFPHYHVANGIDTTVFKALPAENKSEQSKKINVLFVSESLHNYRKGFDIVLDVLNDEDITNRFQLMAIGYVKASSRMSHITYFGIINTEDKMSELYNQADIFLLPSREDNLPNSMIESLCCGTPVVGFAIGGVKETISDGENGYLSKDVSAVGLKQALLTCADNIRLFNRNQIANKAASRFSSEVQVEAITTLYLHSLQLTDEVAAEVV